jgi:hypothetical protein
MGAYGPNPISRLAGWKPQLPASQGYIGTGGAMFVPNEKQFVVPGPIIGTIAPASDDIGQQWAPGQGGDTPGGGGAALIGNTTEVETAWIVDGLVVPVAQAHAAGTVGWVGSRRGKA